LGLNFELNYFTRDFPNMYDWPQDVAQNPCALGSSDGKKKLAFTIFETEKIFYL
jgi:hypothetical protein